MTTYSAYFDGGCEPNIPGGTASYGVIIMKDGETLCEISEIYTPEPGHENETSNNVAEYAGLIAVLEWFIEHELSDAKIIVRGDSMLVIEQMFGKWKIKKGEYVPLALKARELLKPFTNIQGQWIRREHNEVADGLAKAAVTRSRLTAELEPA